MKTLTELLHNICTAPKFNAIKIHGLNLDSRNISPGELFFAYQGNNFDSTQFIPQAIANGAVAILCDTSTQNVQITWQHKIPIIYIPKLAQLIGTIATSFYDNPSQNMTLIGITGTNGKTSTSYLLATLLHQLQRQTGLIGTLGYGPINALIPSNYTTPDPILLQRILAEFKHQQIDTVVMETSSHALTQNRLANINITYGIFTNLTHEHLDYHHNMAAYAQAKKLLFTRNNLQYGIFNLDDPTGAKWFQELQPKLKTYGYTIINSKPHTLENTIYACDIKLTLAGINATINTPWGEAKLKSHLLGRFNLANLLATITTLCLMDYKLEHIMPLIANLNSVPGRLQTLNPASTASQPLVVIDFAHTPDALKQALITLKEHCQGKLFCVFGCGGDRDREKRPKMAQIAEKFADKIFITDDNIRFETSEQIIADITRGFNPNTTIQIEPERRTAIELALKQAAPNDIVLIAGKGCEPYQIIGDQHIPYSDIATATRILSK